ncbi:MAG TPA: type II CAAX endopeptidase family protein, partial [Polyangiaceae bacterium]|nr:type II CAAX endopeptidase family protein [Polyangiaceae bacterium]
VIGASSNERPLPAGRVAPGLSPSAATMLLTLLATWLGVPEPEALPLPTALLAPVSWTQTLLAYPPFKALLPIPILAAIAPVLIWFFKDTWRGIDEEASSYRAAHAGERDLRPAACLVIVAAILTLQEYYGGRLFFQATLRPELEALNAGPWPWLHFETYDDLYGYGWWVFSRVLGYVIIPLSAWKLLFPRDSLLDMGLRGKGFLSHLWIYGACLAIVIPVMLIVAQQPDFGSYYPFYKQSSRSVFDFVVWESMYWVQFFALELFFRGWMLGALRRTMGSSAIFVMAVPYCMIHYGKPYLEANGAIVAGVVLGSLAMRTRSIYAGFLVHISVAAGMDFLSLYKQHGLPHNFWPGS